MAPISTAAPTAERVSGSLRYRLTRWGPPIRFQLVRTGKQASHDFKGQVAEPLVPPRGTLSESSIPSRTENYATRGLGHE